MFDDHVMFSYYSKDGEEGYPGDLMVYVTFTLTELNELIIETQAQCTKTCPVDLSLHLLMNLAGHVRNYYSYIRNSITYYRSP